MEGDLVSPTCFSLKLQFSIEVLREISRSSFQRQIKQAATTSRGDIDFLATQCSYSQTGRLFCISKQDIQGQSCGQHVKSSCDSVGTAHHSTCKLSRNVGQDNDLILNYDCKSYYYHSGAQNGSYSNTVYPSRRLHLSLSLSASVRLIKRTVLGHDCEVLRCSEPIWLHFVLQNPLKVIFLICMCNSHEVCTVYISL